MSELPSVGSGAAPGRRESRATKSHPKDDPEKPTIERVINDCFNSRPFEVLVLGLFVWWFDVHTSGHMVDVFQFPPNWRPVVQWAIPAMALWVWGLTRAKLKSERGEAHWEVTQQIKLQRQLAFGTTVRATADETESRQSDQSPTDQVHSTLIREADVGVLLVHVRKLRRRSIIRASLWAVATVVIFCMYMMIYSNNVVAVSTSGLDDPTTRSASGGSNARSAAEFEEKYPKLVVPFRTPKEIVALEDQEGGLQNVVDNDYEHLRDILNEPAYRRGVFVVEWLLLVLSVGCGISFTITSTLISALPKIKVTWEDVMESL